jgi:hypothetical protein
MIVVKLMGGLGNQMFQYAFGRAISIQYQTSLFFDLDFFEEVKNGKDTISTPRNYEISIFPNARVDVASQQLKNKLIGNKYMNFIRYKLGITKKSIYYEVDPHYNEEINSLKLPLYLIGYWQSWNYFSRIENIIRHEFKFNYEHIGSRNEELLNSIRSERTAVSLHVRRTDYLKNPSNVIPLTYYLDAIDLIRKKISAPVFYLFTDDPEWVRDNVFPGVDNGIVVDWNRNEDSWKDMMLMSNCSHHITANSTFSWWGSWLGANPQKIVIAPKNWFVDDQVAAFEHYPNGWIKI